MATTVKKTKVKKETDARVKIKPRGLWGLYKGEITLNGTSEDVFSLNRLAFAE